MLLFHTTRSHLVKISDECKTRCNPKPWVKRPPVQLTEIKIDDESRLPPTVQKVIPKNIQNIGAVILHWWHHLEPESAQQWPASRAAESSTHCQLEIMTSPSSYRLTTIISSVCPLWQKPNEPKTVVMQHMLGFLLLLLLLLFANTRKNSPKREAFFEFRCITLH